MSLDTESLEQEWNLTSVDFTTPNLTYVDLPTLNFTKSIITNYISLL